jgi:hypothetical protein
MHIAYNIIHGFSNVGWMTSSSMKSGLLEGGIPFSYGHEQQQQQQQMKKLHCSSVVSSSHFLQPQNAS